MLGTAVSSTYSGRRVLDVQNLRSSVFPGRAPPLRLYSTPWTMSFLLARTAGLCHPGILADRQTHTTTFPYRRRVRLYPDCPLHPSRCGSTGRYASPDHAAAAAADVPADGSGDSSYPSFAAAKPSVSIPANDHTPCRDTCPQTYPHPQIQVPATRCQASSVS